MRRAGLSLTAAFALLACQASQGQPPAPAGAVMQWSDLYTLPPVQPDRTFSYGADPLQQVDL